MSFIFSQAHSDEEALRREARDRLNGDALETLLDGQKIRSINRDHGCDMATAILHEALLTKAPNAGFLEQLNSYPCDAIQEFPDNIHILIVPTMYYAEHPELGGDGQLIKTIAETCGAKVSLLKTSSLGTISNNAAELWEQLQSINDEQLWFFSISKGTADLKRTFIDYDDGRLLKRTKGWVNMAGMPGGTPLVGTRKKTPVSNVMMNAWLRLRGGMPGLLEEMNDQHAYSQAELTLPDTLTMINLFGFPLSCHTRRPVDKAHKYLAEMGPNDGYVLFEHAIIRPGYVIPLWSADHYLRTPEFGKRLYQLMHYIKSEENS